MKYHYLATRIQYNVRSIREIQNSRLPTYDYRSSCECAIFEWFDVNMKHQDNYYNIVIYYCVLKEPQYNSDQSKRGVMIQNYYGE